MKNIRLILFARYPVAGQAKTRLIPALGDEGAAKAHKILAQKSALTIFSAAAKVSSMNVEFILAYTGAELHDFQQWLCQETGIADISFLPQVTGDLSDRLLAMINPAPLIFFGSDTPDLSESHISNAIISLHDNDVVIGPAFDGGYYLIGMNKAHEGLFTDMPWSSDKLLPTTLDRCQKLNLKVYMLETLSDCDLPEDLERWPWLLDAVENETL